MEVGKNLACNCCVQVDTIGPMEYNAQSPDEAALVSAARNFGYVFLVTQLLCTGCYNFVILRIVHLAQ